MEQHDAFLWLMGANENLEGQSAAIHCCCCFNSTTATTHSLQCLSLREPLIGNTSCFSVLNEAGLGLRSTCCSHVPLKASRFAETIPKVNVWDYTKKEIGCQWMVWIMTLFAGSLIGWFVHTSEKKKHWLSDSQSRVYQSSVSMCPTCCSPVKVAQDVLTACGPECNQVTLGCTIKRFKGFNNMEQLKWKANPLTDPVKIVEVKVVVWLTETTESLKGKKLRRQLSVFDFIN